jgi:CRISPR/Cas system-associated protein Cas5 (RAMP superfamily)
MQPTRTTKARITSSLQGVRTLIYPPPSTVGGLVVPLLEAIAI